MISVQQVHGKQVRELFQRFDNGKSKKGGQAHGQYNLKAASNE